MRISPPSLGIRPLSLPDLLSRTKLYRGLDPDALASLLASAAFRTLPAGAVLFRQGGEPASLYLLAQGQVKVSQIGAGGAPFTIRYIGPGDIAGCVAVFRRISYPTMATAVVESATLAWTGAQIAEAMDRHPRLMANALDLVGSRAEEMMYRLREMATERVSTRVAQTLLRLHDQVYKQSGCPGTGLAASLAVSHQDIAEMAGTDLYSVSRALSRWRQQGILEAKRCRVVILDRGRLAQLANDGG